MPRHVPLPPDLAERPFAVGEAAARGVGRGRLQSADLARPFYGVRAFAEHDPHDAYLPRLRAQDRFSHTTALELWGAPMPLGFHSTLHVTSPRGSNAPRARGMTGHESRFGLSTELRGLPISDPVTAFLESASLLSFGDLVAVGDYLVLDPRVLDPALIRPLTTLDELGRRAVRAHVRGIVRARAAIAAIRMGVESPMETALRLLLLRAGLPEPVCGFELQDGQRRIGWFDLAWPKYRVIAEYDGAAHWESSKQYDRDIRRFDDAAEIEWKVVRVRKRGVLVSPDDTVRRVAGALERRGWSSGRKRT